MEGDLSKLRSEVLAALRKSISDFATEVDLDPTRRQHANTASRVGWVVENGRKALRDLNIFFAGTDPTNVSFYSGAPVAEYIWISCMFKDAGSGSTTSCQIRSLEDFWLKKDVINWDDRPENIFCVFAKSDRISPGVERLRRAATLLNRKLPTHEEICRSAVIALLFLLKTHLNLTAPDLYYLMAESLGHKELSYRSQLLPELSEDLCLDSDSDTPWHSNTSTTLLSKAFSRSSTKILTFPGKLPAYQTAYNYMDIYQPHGSRPSAKSSCAIWGAWKDERTWRSVASFSNLQAAELYQNCLRRGNTSPPELSSLLSSHWVNLLRYIYKLGINDGRLILRDAMEDIEKIRHSNSAKPSIGSANACLMYVNHFEYFKHMTKGLHDDVESYPTKWKCPAPGEMAPPEWIREVSQECETLHKEVLVITAEVKQVRKLILEQHNLLESRKTNLLTILASIFVPMSFVASFFGMNTREINGASWPLKYYFIAALPLAVLTVLIPLIILPFINFIIRHIATHRLLRSFLHWSWIFITLILCLCLDIMYYLDWYNLSFVIIKIFLMVLVYPLSAGFLYQVFFRVRKQYDKKPERSFADLGPILRKEMWWLLFWILAFSGFEVSITVHPFFELPAYLVYFSIVWIRNRRQKKSIEKDV